MALLVHPNSSESVTLQLDLFSVPPTQTSLEDRFFTEYSKGSIEFCIAPETSNYIALANTFLYVRSSVTADWCRGSFGKWCSYCPRMQFLAYSLVPMRYVYERNFSDSIYKHLPCLHWNVIEFRKRSKRFPIILSSMVS